MDDFVQFLELKSFEEIQLWTAVLMDSTSAGMPIPDACERANEGVRDSRRMGWPNNVIMVQW